MKRLAITLAFFACILAGPVAAATDPAPRLPVTFDAAGYEAGTIIVLTAQRKLYLVTGPAEALVYDIAVGKPSEQWFGKSWVSRKRLNPTWIPTPDMRSKNPNLPQSVGPGPKNPLGVRAINLGWGYYRIHGTNAPNSIGGAASAGCFRMRNADVADLFERVHVGAEVVVLK